MDDTRRLVERGRIADVINTLFVATDARDWPRVRGCLATPVTFDMASAGAGPAAQKTPQEITAAWEAGLKPIESVHHQTGNLSIDCRETEATASCYGIAYHHRRTRSGRNTRVFVGSYDLHLRLHDGAWRIDLFRFNLKFIDGNVDLEKEA
jgi:SnoaL-like protein